MDNQIKDLCFKDNESAFEYACKYCTTDIAERQGLLALVITDQEPDGDGNALYAVKISSDDGGFIVPALFMKNKSDVGIPILTKGDLVIWVPSQYSDEMAKTLGDKRKGWMGYLAAKAEPRLSQSEGWRIKERYV
ncbi:hypothetical protein [Kluyvera ascorbata]|uniref:hypothetical protein n=1 Tax=Kluyvera ascorbata TaxID=51288 RepID=UPI001FE9AF14|nr:hypothetical protein [Kluyvera ascorbata]